jgi:hypothetical protein
VHRGIEPLTTDNSPLTLNAPIAALAARQEMRKSGPTCGLARTIVPPGIVAAVLVLRWSLAPAKDYIGPTTRSTLAIFADCSAHAAPRLLFSVAGRGGIEAHDAACRAGC